RWALLVTVALAACSGAPGTEDVEGAEDGSGVVALEGVGNDFEAINNPSPSCATTPLTGECRYSLVEAFASSV
ncbi:MAG TPA: hypothetical protein VJN18_12345, partial [Polyangiaceae bacterium]|nr:hypothetical protein [Polyangiaceae bacterium]